MQHRVYKVVDFQGLSSSDVLKNTCSLEMFMLFTLYWCMYVCIYCFVCLGDHKQLRPNPADYMVGKNLKLEISLFERLINNGIECYTLNIQHRMRPEISTLLVPTIYPKLLDHPSVQHRDKIKGIEKNVFFIAHNVPEQEVSNCSSLLFMFKIDPI